jgi:hypothetical protein
MNETIIERINENIEKRSLANEPRSLNLESGKLGFCIYFFKLAEIRKERRYQEFAGELFRKICNEVPSYTATCSIYDLAQAGIALDYLVEKGYLRGNINTVLMDFDDIFFMKLTSGKFFYPKSFEIIVILYFLSIRLEKQKKGSDSYFLLEELSIHVFNFLQGIIYDHFLEEPLLFTLEYNLPLVVFILSKLNDMNFYKNRLDEIIKEISGLIVSHIPVLHSNRLYLLWALVHLKQSTGLSVWDEHIEILHEHIDCYKIIFQELKNRDIFIRDGLSGIYLLLADLAKTPYGIPYETGRIIQKFEDSNIWEEEPVSSIKSCGLINGICGSILTYLLIGKDDKT